MHCIYSHPLVQFSQLVSDRNSSLYPKASCVNCHYFASCSPTCFLSFDSYYNLLRYLPSCPVLPYGLIFLTSFCNLLRHLLSCPVLPYGLIFLTSFCNLLRQLSSCPVYLMHFFSSLLLSIIYSSSVIGMSPTLVFKDRTICVTHENLFDHTAVQCDFNDVLQLWNKCNISARQWPIRNVTHQFFASSDRLSRRVVLFGIRLAELK
jgi:hypothetical protein